MGLGSIKQLGDHDRVACQTVSREQRGEYGGQRVTRGHPEQRGECRLLDDSAHQHGAYVGGSAGERCDLDHTPAGCITASTVSA
jgi:hypothetical protein